MSRLQLPLAHTLRIALAACTLTSLAACDPGEVHDVDALELDEFDVELDIEALDGTEPGEAASGVLATEQGNEQPVIQVTSWTIISDLNSLADGDIVQLGSRQQGFVGCPGLSTVSATHAPASGSQGYTFTVHVVDIDMDGQTERQFEALDVQGNPTGRFLKMEDDLSVECNVIGGIGDAAAWTQASGYSATTSGWTLRYGQMRSLKHQRCIEVSDPNAPVGDTCSGGYRAFSFHVLN
ncbi:hypothetical protein [Enhygromyxa salina]|uniref:Lipoprotein n=1 Tax=Enhygromyxa salina TaxID=215803 RepID=A0A2S9XT79_9BACT|nr:hypothetical protein [Enhygromyxa salina]PRP96069.1 hypothetical protein ENSA7_68830 [Enhygromyxa salina]